MKSGISLVCSTFVLVAVCFGEASASIYPHDRLAWIRQMAGSSARADVRCYGDGSSLMVGVRGGPFAASDLGEHEPPFFGPFDSFAVKRSADGEVSWAKTLAVLNGQAYYLVIYPRDNDSQVSFLEDGRFACCGSFDTQATLGKGDPNETTLTCTEGLHGYVASYGADGSLAWARNLEADLNATPQNVLPCSGIALVSDGTCYVLSSINRASGALLTALIKYDSAGNVLWTHNVEQWAFSSVRGHHLLPISDGLIVAAARLQRVSSSGSILWENAAYSGYQDSFSSIEGTDDFIVYKAALSGQQRRIERWTPEPVCVWSMPEGVVWSGEGAVSARPDGSGNVLLNQSSRQPFIQPFSSNGLLGNTNSLGGSENCEHWWDIDTFPSEDAFLISGFLGGSGTFGAGQPNETTLTGPALFLAKYRAETLYYLDADVIGYGNVEIRPSVVPRQSYSADTPVTLRAVPNWPNHDRFVEWQGDFTGTNDEITINLTGDSHVTAIFEEIPGAPPLPAISTGVLATLAAVLAGIGLVRRK